MIDPVPFAENLGLALLLGAVVGLEREWRGHDAGIKTNALVSAGSALFMMVSLAFGDGGRVAAQVVTGVGFLGAGNIMRAGDHVRGLTTAATLWMMAGVGLIAGTGQARLALISGMALLAINLVLLPLENFLVRMRKRASSEELAQNGARSGPVPGSLGGTRRTLRAPKTD